MGLLNWMLNADSDEILQLDWSLPCWDGSSNSLSLPLSILQLLCANSFSHRFRSLFFKMETVELPPAKDLDINVLCVPYFEPNILTSARSLFYLTKGEKIMTV